ncbi:hypothetical protein RQP46_000493 [Phenoliferia psychrophenolica]
MAKRGALSQEYVSDDDFLDDSEEGGKKKKKPAAKKAPAAKKPKKENSDDEDEDDAPLAEGSAPGVNDQGDRFFKLGETGSRRVTVREFKKSILIDIREASSSSSARPCNPPLT